MALEYSGADFKILKQHSFSVFNGALAFGRVQFLFCVLLLLYYLEDI